MLHLESTKKVSGGNFVLEDLGDVGLFVREGVVDEVQTEVDRMMEKNLFEEKKKPKKKEAA